MSAEPHVSPHTLVHAKDPPSSAEAARDGSETKVGGRRACLHVHRHYYEGLTDDEVSSITGIELHECRRRCTDLRNLGLIEFATDASRPGRFLSRPSAAGRNSTVSRITPAGHRALA